MEKPLDIVPKAAETLQDYTAGGPRSGPLLGRSLLEAMVYAEPFYGDRDFMMQARWKQSKSS